MKLISILILSQLLLLVTLVGGQGCTLHTNNLLYDFTPLISMTEYVGSIDSFYFYINICQSPKSCMNKFPGSGICISDTISPAPAFNGGQIEDSVFRPLVISHQQHYLFTKQKQQQQRQKPIDDGNRGGQIEYKHGTECGMYPMRSTVIRLRCSESATKLERVSQPITCKYVIDISSYLACPMSDSGSSTSSGDSSSGYPTSGESTTSPYTTSYPTSAISGTTASAHSTTTSTTSRTTTTTSTTTASTSIHTTTTTTGTTTSKTSTSSTTYSGQSSTTTGAGMISTVSTTINNGVTTTGNEVYKNNIMTTTGSLTGRGISTSGSIGTTSGHISTTGGQVLTTASDSSSTSSSTTNY
ncbi:hypothetical protein PPL_06038 [Heterostelium album PN500]|uniref:MRH domain-containing protein n=1 Tax=Heterostelium pallidum (strain ATCC 26659 / Pp 5 / PN500) TaxID=670386 RepID=D3BC18_HETP5|nr:hypothetical protein PPL_06038 [Heterostelium album PN500]EFA81201.1 hypothetical protein PPL_06038 [Heterostelium album PN500]|eukprot:XP_020433319.1 hypothetical protein PPL_06038 [Heterostelium album PN500]